MGSLSANFNTCKKMSLCLYQFVTTILHFYNYIHDYWKSFYLIYLALLPTWLNLKYSNLTQLCIYIGAKYTQGIMQLWTIFLKEQTFKKITSTFFFQMHTVLWDTCHIFGSFDLNAKWAYIIMNCLSCVVAIMCHWW